jgi:hypothetical protein
VGVPRIAPSLVSVRPAGRTPHANDQLKGVIPPVVLSVREYATPTNPAGRAEEGITIEGGVTGEIVRVNAAVAVAPALSATRSVKLKTPAEVGHPLITPSESPRPPGSAPDASDNL